MSMGAYNVPKDEREKTVAFVMSMDKKNAANSIMQKLFESLAMRFEIELN